MIIPPPNVTGTLHLGHALATSVEDSICRWLAVVFYSKLLLYLEYDVKITKINLGNRCVSTQIWSVKTMIMLVMKFKN